MGTVMVKCPDTGHDISTGIVADRASFNATPVFRAGLLPHVPNRARMVRPGGLDLRFRILGDSPMGGLTQT